MEAEYTVWQPINYLLWNVVEFSGAFYTLISMEGFDNNATPMESDFPKTPHDKALQRALMQWRKPQNRNLVLEALHRTGREDLIGYGKRCLIRPDKGHSAQSQSSDRRPSGSGGRSAPSARTKKGSGDPRRERFDGRRTVEKKSGPARPVRKAGWAKPKKKK